MKSYNFYLNLKCEKSNQINYSNISVAELEFLRYEISDCSQRIVYAVFKYHEFKHPADIKIKLSSIKKLEEFKFKELVCSNVVDKEEYNFHRDYHKQKRKYIGDIFRVDRKISMYFTTEIFSIYQAQIYTSTLESATMIVKKNNKHYVEEVSSFFMLDFVEKLYIDKLTNWIE